MALTDDKSDLIEALRAGGAAVLVRGSASCVCNHSMTLIAERVAFCPR